jgi:hypothetical protein
VIGRLYQHNIGPGGELLVKRRQSRGAEEREAAAVAAYRAAHPHASAAELAGVRAAERGTDPHRVPYFDLTVDVGKSVSVLHASYRVAARQARERGEPGQAALLDARADEIEAALLDAAREAVAWPAPRRTCPGNCGAPPRPRPTPGSNPPPPRPGRTRPDRRTRRRSPRHKAARRGQLEAANARHQTWAAGTGSSREAAGKARAELQRREVAQQTAGRRHAEPEDEPQTAAEWWRQLEAGLAAVDRALQREQQAAIAAGQPWPPQRTAQAQTTHPGAAAVSARLQRDGYRPEPNPDSEAPIPEPAANTAAIVSEHEHGGRPARLDALQARADQAAHRIAAGNAARAAREHYTARRERQARARAEPAAERQAEALDGIEIEP